MASYDENSKTSGNAYSGRTLKRMELQYKDINIRFAVNPTDYTQIKPNKASITQTKGGAWIDAWGAGVVEFTIKGTTGVKGGTNSIDTGYQRWKALENLFDTLYEAITDGEEVKDLIQFYNHTDNVFYYCYPTQNGIELNRSSSKPHLYQYTIHLWGIHKIGQPETSSGTIGNPNKATGSGTSSVTSINQAVSMASGGTYTTKDKLVAYNTEVDTSTVTNTKTKTIQGIQDDCLDCITALEPIIGGNHGKISPITGFQCTHGITMQSLGTISNVDRFSGSDLADKLDILLNETKFSSKASVETYTMYTQMKNYSPEVLSPEYSLIVGTTPRQRVIQAVSNSKAYDSTIYSLMVQYQSKSLLTKTEVNYLKIILLESMMVYRELYDIYNQTSEELTTTLTLTNMSILIKNIQAVIIYFVFNSTDINEHQKQDISAELRKLEKIMTQICTDIVDYL